MQRAQARQVLYTPKKIYKYRKKIKKNILKYINHPKNFKISKKKNIQKKNKILNIKNKKEIFFVIRIKYNIHNWLLKGKLLIFFFNFF